MIRLNSPDAEKIFRAGGYTDRIKSFCRKYILESYNERKDIFQKMKSECSAFSEFSKSQFKERNEAIQLSINEVINEIKKLEAMNEITQEGHCNVCNAPLKTHDTLVSDKILRFITVCPNCPEKIHKLLDTLDWATGAVFI
ncbi:Spc97/Spc98 family protein [Chryseobacterium hagamense]|uniref:Uncharacterized protein n=1 Tax=Chryseobacterium hagamense TaxID=395935 RepID=A0A511YHX1_9FLAO|nr:Spc97/Spc98 family protein [Chryseobacterium hagamense]GEN74782.1 hypothetical protein CHA01nite_05220 [Chryseobacterium hagamense]